MIWLVDLDFDADEPLAVFEAAFLPAWQWEVYAVEDDGAYYGRVSSPSTFGGYDYGRFSRTELRTGGAFRTDEDMGEWP